MYSIKFYTDKDGRCPFQLFLESLQPKVRAKIIKFMDILAEYGPNLKRPYADMLRDDIRELRVQFGSNKYRGLYFFIQNNHIIMTHGILKNTSAVPVEEIEKAIRYKKELENRLKKEDLLK